MTLVDVHARLANTALFFCVIMGVWGVWRFFRRQGVDGSYWGAVVIAEVLLIAQGILGGYLWITGLRPVRNIHLLYGIVSVLALPLIYFYTKGQEERRDMLMYGAGFLIMVGLVLRAMTTGGG
jgi:heme A synthase